MENVKNIYTESELEELRKSLNESIDDRKEELRRLKRANYMQEQNFGYIKENFENLSTVLFESKDGRELIGRFIDTVKNDKTLSRLYSIFEGIRNSHNGCDVDSVVNIIKEACLKMPNKNTQPSTAKVGKLLAEAYFLAGDKADSLISESNPRLNWAINYLAENKPKMGNVVTYSSAVEIVKESVKQNADRHDVNENTGKNIEMMVSEFNAKYAGILNPEEQAMFKKIMEASDKNATFVEFQEKCINSLTEARDATPEKESAGRIDEVINKVREKSFNDDTYVTDIYNMMEITNLFG